MNKKDISQVKNLRNKRVFVTCDFNISLKDGKIANDTRIKEALPTLKYLLDRNCRLILASHLNRPNGHDLTFSLKPVAEKLHKYLNREIELLDYFWKPGAIEKIKNSDPSRIILLENIRFVKEEKENSQAFSQHLSKMADIFVNDAFGASHRVHASIVGISKFLPSYAGLLLAKEIRVLEKALNNPDRPLVVFIGGAKTPEKISVIEKLLDIADTVALGGAIANTFLAAWGFGMGQSLVDYEMVEMARKVFWQTTRKHTAVILPLDVVISLNHQDKKKKVVDYDKVPSHVAIYDIGPKTSKAYADLARRSKTIIWNGPMGYYEKSCFCRGTNELIKNIAASKAFKIIGGGDTLSVLKNPRYINRFDHISTGGSAMLAFIKDGTLPGIEVLENV